ncbi:hypothetical protein SAMN05444364_15810 [Prevotella scopos JCM 17725]|uniref:MSHA biogenesis protein MshK n=1 Tax=Prevotella scopos JCM 17725 TaxID=1236518 RepID=A0AAX2F7P9_9BACT|nr:hypothetical protein SAMN05444364_15810 [Prevotella scopos JCM 17725]
MLQIGSYCDYHLIINVIVKRLGAKAGKRLSAFCHICNQNKEKIILQERFALYAPD